MMSNSSSSDTSGSGSGFGSGYGSGSGSPEASSELVSNSTGKVGGQSKLSDLLSADSGSSTTLAESSESPPKKPKLMDRDEKIAYLEDMIKNKDATLTSLSEEIKKLAEERRAMLKLPESSRDGLLLKSIDDDLPDMRKDRDRLAAEILKHEAGLNALKNPKEPADAPVPAQGMQIYVSSAFSSAPTTTTTTIIIIIIITITIIAL